MANEARMVETSAPATIAPTRPRRGCPVSVPIIAATKAPASSCASIAMLTTPTRSEITPPSAPKMSGVLTVSAPARSPTRGTVAPAAAHVRNPSRKISANTVVSHSGTLRAARTSRNAPTAAAAMRMTVTMPVA